MHGMIHAEFRDYAIGRVGNERWKSLLGDAGISSHVYSWLQSYPDDELLVSVMTLARDREESVETVLRQFGARLVPQLLRRFGPYVRPGWRTADVLEHVERVIHNAVRLQDAEASPPHLRAERSVGEIVIHYNSPRRLCALGHGLIEGLADHFGEHAAIEQTTCMHRGDDACAFHVTVGDAGPRAPARDATGPSSVLP